MYSQNDSQNFNSDTQNIKSSLIYLICRLCPFTFCYLRLLRNWSGSTNCVSSSSCRY